MNYTVIHGFAEKHFYIIYMRSLKGIEEEKHKIFQVALIHDRLSIFYAIMLQNIAIDFDLFKSKLKKKSDSIENRM